MKRQTKWVIAATALAFISATGYAQQEATDIPKFAHSAMSHEWYLEQGKLWRAEIDRNRSNARAWFNYYKANRYAGFTAEPPDPQQERRLAALVDDMGAAIPETFEYHYTRWWNGGNDASLFPHLERAFALRQDYSLLSGDFVVYYEMHGQRDKVAEFCRKWYQSATLPRTALNYQYNVLMSLEHNAILVTGGDMDTYPVWMLQHVKNVRPDVTMLNTFMMNAPDYRRRMMRELGLNGNAEAATGPEFWASVVAANPARPIYFALTLQPELTASFKDNLYTVGLANRYSPRRVDNIAILKRNWEKFRLDYLTMDFYDENDPFNDGYLQMLNMNYVMPAALLYEHYTLAGEHEKADRFRQIAMRIAQEGKQEQEVAEYFSGLAGDASFRLPDQDRRAAVDTREDGAFGGSIKVFPNPSYNDLTVQLPEAIGADIRVVDTKGNLVRTVSARGPEIRIDIAGLPAGSYLLNIRTDRGVFTRNVQVVR